MVQAIAEDALVGVGLHVLPWRPAVADQPQSFQQTLLWEFVWFILMLKNFDVERDNKLPSLPTTVASIYSCIIGPFWHNMSSRRDEMNNEPHDSLLDTYD